MLPAPHAAEAGGLGSGLSCPVPGCTRWVGKREKGSNSIKEFRGGTGTLQNPNRPQDHLGNHQAETDSLTRLFNG